MSIGALISSTKPVRNDRNLYRKRVRKFIPWPGPAGISGPARDAKKRPQEPVKKMSFLLISAISAISAHFCSFAHIGAQLPRLAGRAAGSRVLPIRIPLDFKMKCMENLQMDIRASLNTGVRISGGQIRRFELNGFDSALASQIRSIERGPMEGSECVVFACICTGFS